MHTIQYIIEILRQKDLLKVFLVIGACFCFYTLRRTDKRFHPYIWIIYSFILAKTLFFFGEYIIDRIQYPDVWDFTAFYLYGKVAVLGHDYYSPEFLEPVFNSLSLPALDYSNFKPAVIPVGFLYPPPTIFLFTPLGFFSYETARMGWMIFILISAAVSIYLIYDLFLRSYRMNGIFLLLIIFILTRPVTQNIQCLQTNFIALSLLLLLKKYFDKSVAGVILALAFLTKPYMIAFGVLFLMWKQWKSMFYFLISLLVMTGATLLVFGKEPFISYLFNNPSNRLPNILYLQGWNQSLLGVLMRFGLIKIDSKQAYTFIAAPLLILGGWYLTYLYKKKLFDYMWAVLLLVTLIIYPGTQAHYGVMLLFIVIQFFDKERQLGFRNIYLNIFLMGIFYSLCVTSLFATNCFLLVVILLKSFFLTHSQSGSSLANPVLLK